MRKLILITSLLLNISALGNLPHELHSLPEDGNIKVFIEKENGKNYFVKIDTFPPHLQISKVTKIARQFNGFTLNPMDHSRYRIHSTKQKTLVKGTLREIFQLYIKGSQKPTRLLAIENSSPKLKSDFQKQEFEIPKQEKSLAYLEKKCGYTPKIEAKTSIRNFLMGIGDLCANEDSIYKNEVQKLKKVSFLKGEGKEPIFSKEGSTLTIKSNDQLYNSASQIYAWLKENL